MTGLGGSTSQPLASAVCHSTSNLSNRLRNALCWCWFKKKGCCCEEGKCCYKEPLNEWKRRLHKKAEKEREKRERFLRRRSEGLDEPLLSGTRRFIEHLAAPAG